MTIERLQQEILRAIKIEDKQINFLMNESNATIKYLGSLENFVKKLFKEYKQGE